MLPQGHPISTDSCILASGHAIVKPPFKFVSSGTQPSIQQNEQNVFG